MQLLLTIIIVTLPDVRFCEAENDSSFFFFSRSHFVAGENTAAAIVSVKRTGDISTAASIRYATAEGTARADEDYRNASGVLQFAAGEEEKTFTVPVIDNSNLDGERTVVMSLTEPTGNAGLNDQSSAILGIRDNEIGFWVDPDFRPDLGNLWSVCSILITNDGKIVVTGNTIRSTSSKVLGFNWDGTREYSHDSTSLCIPMNQSEITLPDGGFLSGGGGSLRRRYANGSEDLSFHFFASELGLDDPVSVQLFGINPDGRIVVALNLEPRGSGILQGQLVFLNQDGTLWSMGPVFDRSISALAIAPDGSVLVSCYERTVVNGLSRGLVRILPDGSANRGLRFSSVVFHSGERHEFAAVTVERTGETSAPAEVEFFTTPGTAHSSVNASEFPDFDAQSGVLRFNPLETSKEILIPLHRHLLVEPDKKFTVSLRNVSPGSRLGEGPISAEVIIHDEERPGSVDFGFEGPKLWLSSYNYFGPVVSALAVQPDGKVLVSGSLQLLEETAWDATSLFRLNADGSLDSTFRAQIPIHRFAIDLSAPSVMAIAVQPDGKILVGGTSVDNSLYVNGELREGIARLNTDGTLDQGFAAKLDGGVHTISLLNDGRILLGGSFSGGITRLRPDGSLDPTFNIFRGANTAPFRGGFLPPRAVRALIVQPDQKILVGGDFFLWNGVPRNGVARLTPDGSLDQTFDPKEGLGSATAQNQRAPAITSMALQTDGKILIAGRFDNFAGVHRGGLVRLTPDGSLDSSFSFGGDNYSELTVALLRDRVLVGGIADGGPGIRALDLSGASDKSFNPGLGVENEFDDGQTVSALLPLADGSVLVGGSFSQFDGVKRFAVTRLHGDPPLRIASLALTPHGEAQLQAVGLPGRSHIIESSIDLRTWVPIRTNTPENYILSVEDLEPAKESRRFYRVLRPNE